MTTPTPLDLDVLAGLLPDARPDHPWYDVGDLTEALEPIADVGDDAAADARFIAALSPAVVLALIERMQAAEERGDAIRTQHLATIRQRDEARAALARVEALADEGDASSRHINGYVLLRDLRAALAPTPGAEQEGAS